jgi:DnaJ-class molecular chaperone
MQIVECFKILNVVPGEDWRKVRQSYYSLAKQFHPDINSQRKTADSHLGENRLKEINQAFEKLESHYKASDNVLPEQLEIFKQKPNKLRNLFYRLKNKPAVQHVVNSGLNFLVDLDSKVFQLDIQKNVRISESTLQKGASLHLKSGKEHFDVKVPSGDWNQMSLRIPGKGESSIFSKRRGDLVLNLHGPTQKIAGTGKSRFSYEMKIPHNQIADGRVMTLNSSEGPIKFILPRNTRDSQKFTLYSAREGASETLHILTVRLG